MQTKISDEVWETLQNLFNFYETSKSSVRQLIRRNELKFIFNSDGEEIDLNDISDYDHLIEVDDNQNNLYGIVACSGDDLNTICQQAALIVIPNEVESLEELFED